MGEKGLRRQKALGPERLCCSGFTCQQNEPPTKEGGARYCGSCLESAEVRGSLETLRLGVRDQPRQTDWLAVAMFKKKKRFRGMSTEMSLLGLSLAEYDLFLFFILRHCLSILFWCVLNS